MSSEMVKFGPQSYGELVSYIDQIMRSPACPAKSAADALLIVMTGAELGIPPMRAAELADAQAARAVRRALYNAGQA